LVLSCVFDKNRTVIVYANAIGMAVEILFAKRASAMQKDCSVQPGRLRIAKKNTKSVSLIFASKYSLPTFAKLLNPTYET